MNPKPESGLMSFRYGAFKSALQVDARLWALVTINNEQSWPRKAQIGGFPASIGLDFQPIAPNGARALVECLRRDPHVDHTEPDHVLLAMGVQRIMQTKHDELKEWMG